MTKYSYDGPVMEFNKCIVDGRERHLLIQRKKQKVI